MNVICPHCNSQINLNFENHDIDTRMWNFDGNRAEIEVEPYCENCERDFIVMLQVRIDIIGFTICE